MATLGALMSELRALANDLKNPAILEHLDMRAAIWQKRETVSSKDCSALRNCAMH